MVHLPASLASCDPDWIAFQGSCYNLIPYPMELNGSILESRWGCLEIGSDLVKITSEDEHVFITDLLGTVKVCDTFISFISLDSYICNEYTRATVSKVLHMNNAY